MRYPRVEPPPVPEVKDEDDVLIIEMKLRSNRFESRIEIPLRSSDADKREFVSRWLSLMDAGLKCGPRKVP